MIEILREENQDLEEQLKVVRGREAALIEQNIVTGVHAISGLVLVVGALARVTPNTTAGRAALEKARELCLGYGIPLPASLQKKLKAKRRKSSRKKKRSSSTTRPQTRPL